jgi:hypothetical protein
MQYTVDSILNDLDAAKHDVIAFLKGYGFEPNPTSEEEQMWNRNLYLMLKDNFSYLEDGVRVHFIIDFPLLILPNHRHTPACGTLSFWIHSGIMCALGQIRSSNVWRYFDFDFPRLSKNIHSFLGQVLPKLV